MRPALAEPADAGIFGRADHPVAFEVTQMRNEVGWSAGGALELGRLNRRIRDDAPYQWSGLGFAG